MLRGWFVALSVQTRSHYQTPHQRHAHRLCSLQKTYIQTVKMLRKSLLNIGLYVNRRQRRWIHRATAALNPLNPVNPGDIHRRDASTSTVMGANNKVKTMDELDGPSFMATLYWLFIKGHFKTAQQMQVSGIRTHGSAQSFIGLFPCEL